MTQFIKIYTDASLLKHSDKAVPPLYPGAFAAVVHPPRQDSQKTLFLHGCGFAADSFELELAAAQYAVRIIPKNAKTEIVTDCLTIVGILEHGKKQPYRKRFKNGEGVPFDHYPHYLEITHGMSFAKCELSWTPGHADCAGNNLADQLARAVARAYAHPETGVATLNQLMEKHKLEPIQAPKGVGLDLGAGAASQTAIGNRIRLIPEQVPPDLHPIRVDQLRPR